MGDQGKQCCRVGRYDDTATPRSVSLDAHRTRVGVASGNCAIDHMASGAPSMHIITTVANITTSS